MSLNNEIRSSTKERCSMKRDIFVARQPIFDKEMNLCGYELLYKQNTDNPDNNIDEDTATVSLVNNTVLIFGFKQLIDNTRGFVKFSASLLENDIALMLPKEDAVVEIPQSTKLTQKVLDACRKLSRFGYTIALGTLPDFADPKKEIGDDWYLQDELMELADIIKIDISQGNPKEQNEFIRKYKGEKTFLAIKVETADQYQAAINAGYQLFQGCFFSSPVIVKARDIHSLDTNLFRIIEELNKPFPDLKTVSDIIEMDLGLSYKLLRMANSVAYGSRLPIKSIHQAVIHFGIQETLRWANLIFLKGLQHGQNSEVIKISLIRGKLMSLIAKEIQPSISESDCFLVGTFSLIDLLLGQDMAQIVSEMPFTDTVRDALLGKKNQVRSILDALIAYELGEWEACSSLLSDYKIDRERFMELYLQTLDWQQALPN